MCFNHKRNEKDMVLQQQKNQFAKTVVDQERNQEK
jgi:hypothetical protein